MKDKSRIHDLTGQRFGRLTVIGLADTNTRKTYWVCQCDCGKLKNVRSDSLLSGAIRSCGCMKKEQDKKNLINTNMKKTQEAGFKRGNTRLYIIWRNMVKRCCDVHDARYHRYGGRGIAVCDEWREDFIAFHNWAMENGYSEDLTIDRIDNDGNYYPDNCRWSTAEEQARNRSTNIKITIGNATKTLTEWCEIFEVDYKTVLSRYNRKGFIGIDDLFNHG